MTPRIYIACLASYNAGKLFGTWIDANQTTAAIQNEIAAMLSASSEPLAEEWALHDYEGFDGIHLSEWPCLERVSALARLMDEHGDAFSIWYETQDGCGLGTGELEEKFLEQWQGLYESEVAFADHLLESTGQLAELPEWAKNYFDFEGYARDLRLSGSYSFVFRGRETYVYSNF